MKRDRRRFLQQTLAGGTAATLPAGLPAQPAGTEAFFSRAETAFVRAWVDHMVPADALSPSGSELGIDAYIDRALAGRWGQGERMYLQGPWKQGLLSQGYQLPYNRAQIARGGIEATERYCRRTWGRDFSALAEAEREQLMRGLEAAQIRFEDGVPAKTFFELMLRLVMEGLFADPVHGGNRGKAGWRMVGFPGAGGRYRDKLRPHRDKAYDAEPKGIEDV